MSQKYRQEELGHMIQNKAISLRVHVTNNRSLINGYESYYGTCRAIYIYISFGVEFRVYAPNS